MPASMRGAPSRSLILHNVSFQYNQRYGTLNAHVSRRSTPSPKTIYENYLLSSLRPTSAPNRHARRFVTTSPKPNPFNNSKPFDITEEAEQTELVRHLMRLVPHPVAIITSTDHTPSSLRETHISYRWRGATVSSFNTVTLTPSPIVSFNIKRQSATFTAIESSGSFGVHLLNNVLEAESVAAKFAGGNAANPFHDSKGQVASFVLWDESQGKATAHQQLAHDSEQQPPIIHGPSRDGSVDAVTAFRLQCHYLGDKTVEIGDHVVVFGQVVEVDQVDTRETDSKPCLVYVDRRYGVVK